MKEFDDRKLVENWISKNLSLKYGETYFSLEQPEEGKFNVEKFKKGFNDSG